MLLTAFLAATTKGPLETLSPTFFGGLALFLPVIAVLVILTFTIDSRRLSAWISTVFTFAALACALVVLAIEVKHPGYREHTNIFLHFFTSQSGAAVEFELDWGVLADPLAAVMLVTVNAISLCIQIYSLGYLRREDGVVRFFAVTSFATFAMSGVVVSNNYAELFFFWVLAGIATYVLIGHHFQRERAALAARKALTITLLGDTGLLAGIIYIFFRFHTLNFQELAPLYTAGKVGANGLLVMSLLVFAGAAGKAGLLPLHTWLADSAEAPAPAAAVIHAATMAAAGVYLVARAYALFHASPRALVVVGVVGGVTAVVAGLWALAQDNLKRLIAYATMSELGLAMLALGAGAYSAGTFHLFTHAWSKALLFLGAGMIVRELRTESMTEMGGLWRRMPVTGVLMLIGAAAAGGIPPLSGFTSKDAIVSRLLLQKNALVAGLVVVVVFLSAAYMFRMFFLVFGGVTARRRRFDPERIRDPAGRAVAGMVLLAVFAALVGLHDLARVANEFTLFVTFPGQSISHAASLNGTLLTGAAGVLGLLVAWIVFGWRVVSFGARLPWAGRAMSQGFYIDRAYGWALEIGPTRLSAGLNWIDRGIIDGFVDRIGASIAAVGVPSRWMPRARLQLYALGVFLGLLLLAAATAVLAGHGLKGLTG